MLTGIDQITLLPQHEKNHTEKQYQDLLVQIKKDGILTPLLLDQEFSLLNGYLRFRIAKELKIDNLPFLIYPILLTETERNIFFSSDKQVFSSYLDPISRVKYLVLFYPEVFLLDRKVIRQSFVEKYKEISSTLNISMRQLQRDKQAYLLAKQYSFKKKKGYVNDSHIAKAMRGINQQRRQTNNIENYIFSTLRQVYLQQSKPEQAKIQKKLNKLIKKYKPD